LQPIFLSTPIELGGLGLDPPAIGTIMSFFGILEGVFTLFCFSRIVDCFGLKKVHLMGMAAAAPSFALFPIISYLAHNSTERSEGLGTGVWLVIALQVALAVLVYLCYGVSTSKCWHLR
jgi:MFS family permease